MQSLHILQLTLENQTDEPLSKSETGFGTLATHNPIHTSHHTTRPMSPVGSVELKLFLIVAI
jgi:hypothetical protein